LRLDPVRYEVFPGSRLPPPAERAVQGDQVQGDRPSGGDQAVLLPDQELLGSEDPGVIRRSLAILEIGQFDGPGG